MHDRLFILNDFISAIENDTRITTAHISLFVMLWNKWAATENGTSVIFYKYELMPLCRISSRSTFHKIIKQLHAYGYIHYAPSYNHYVGSRVEFFQSIKT